MSHFKDKLTLFWSCEDVDASACALPEPIRATIAAVRDKFGYLPR